MLDLILGWRKINLQILTKQNIRAQLGLKVWSANFIRRSDKVKPNCKGRAPLILFVSRFSILYKC